MIMKKISSVLFWVVSVGEVGSVFMDLPLLHKICKPAILPLLLVYYVFSQRESKKPISITLNMALLFSWGGDVFLMNDGERFFILGLLSFLTAHVFYIFTFRQFRYETDQDSLHGLQRIRFAFPIILYGSGLVVILYNQLGQLQMPVLFYALVLTIMVLQALFRFNRTSTSSFAMVFGGAILFMISDSLLAVNKFLEPITYSGLWIMGTYIGAQFLIVKGLLRHSG